MSDCLFCKIIAGEIPSTQVYADDHVVAFKDIHPRAKTHLLIVPRKHIDTIMALKKDEADEVLVGQMVEAARDIASTLKLTGYQLLFNVGKDGGQMIFHIHLHLMSDQ